MIEKVLGFIERRWGVVVIIGALVGGLIGAIVHVTASDVYVARSLVVLTQANIPPDEFADVARAMFPTDAVMLPVIRDLGLDRTPAQLISSGTAEIDALPGGLSVSVIARTSGPDLAVTIANEIGAQLRDVSQVNGIGRLAVFPAEGPATLQADPLSRDVAVGMLVGAFIAALDAALVILIRRRALGSDGRFRFESMLRVDVSTDPEEGTVVVTAARPLASFVRADGDGEAGETVAVTLDDGRDLWATLAVAEELSRLAASSHDGGLRVLEAGTELGDAETIGELIVVAADHTPSSRLRDLRRVLRRSTGDAPMTLLLVHADDGA